MNLSNLLHQAVNGQSNLVQKQAEQQLMAVFHKDPKNFMLSLAQIVASEQQTDSIRQAAGTVLSRNIFTMLPDNKSFLWTTFQQQITSQIKTLLLGTLGSERELPKRAASDAISKIASIDVPSGKWNQLLPALVNAAGTEDVKIKKTAVMALGFICMEFKQHKIAITHQQTEQTFTAIYLGLVEPNADVKREALKALGACIIYMTDILKNQKFREKTVMYLMQCFAQPTLVQYTLQVFLEYAKYYYQFLGEIIQLLYQATSNIIQSYGEATVTALELWHTIAEQYLERRNVPGTQNYILGIGDDIVKMLLTCMLHCEKDDENNIREAAYRTLFPICQGCEGMCLQSVSHFVSNVLTSPDWKCRQASALAFSTITNTENKTVKQWLQTGIDRLFGLLGDVDDFVVQSTAAGLAKIFEQAAHAEMILKRKNSNQYIDCLTQLLNRNEGIVNRTLEALSKLTQPLQKNFNCDLAKNIFSLLNVLTLFIFRSPPVTASMMQASSITILQLLQGNKDQKILRQYTEHILQKCALAVGNTEEIKNLKSCLMVILHTAVLSVRDTLEQSFASAISQLVQNHFKQINTVDQDGLFLIGAMAIRMNDSFYPYFGELGPYVAHGMTIKNQPATYRVCIGVVCDVCKAIGRFIPCEIDRYLSDFINEFQGEGDRNLKGPLIGAMGDLIREANNAEIIMKHMNSIMQIAQVSVSACIHLSNSGEDVDYAEELKEILIDFLECLCSGIGKDFLQYVPSVLDLAMTFVLATCKRQANPTLSHFKKGIYLVFDVGSVLIAEGQDPELAKSRFSQPAFIEIFNSLRDVPFDQEIKNLESYGRAVFSALKIGGVKYI